MATKISSQYHSWLLQLNLLWWMAGADAVDWDGFYACRFCAFVLCGFG